MERGWKKKQKKGVKENRKQYEYIRIFIAIKLNAGKLQRGKRKESGK